MKKPIKYVLYLGLIILSFFWVAKQFGYPLTWYLLNAKYNYSHVNKIETKMFELEVPYWKWKILDDTEKSSKLEGISPDRTFISAFIRKDVELYDLENIQKMCKEELVIDILEKKFFEEYNIYCNMPPKGLNPYRIFWIKNKIFLHMDNYNKKYQHVYDELLSKIELKS